VATHGQLTSHGKTNDTTTNDETVVDFLIFFGGCVGGGGGGIVGQAMCQQIGRCDVVSGEAIGGARCNGDEDGRSEVVGDDVEHLVAAKAAQGVVRGVALSGLF